MDPGTLLGIVIAFVCLLVAMILEGGQPTSVLLIPALMIVFGGTLGATLAGGTVKEFTSGVAHIHFFSGGWTEPAQIELTDGDAFITLKLFPLTGRVRTYQKELEVPKPEDDDGREEQEVLRDALRLTEKVTTG